MRKKVDSRLRILIENGCKSRYRSLFVIVGDRGRDQVVNLHYILSKITTKKPSVLWCYKQELGFSSHKRRRMKQLKKRMQHGQFDQNIDDPFELFVTTTNIRYCYYKESQAILGQTFGMCVLQDFEALTPNILCRTMETVEGGGIICVLLNSMSSLRQLYATTMDIHCKFRTEGFQTVEPRFNERFILSLASCSGCLIVDDELNILPLSRHAKQILPIEKDFSIAKESQSDSVQIGDGLSAFLSTNQKELRELKESLKEVDIVGCLVERTVTCDQARCIMTFANCLSNRNLRQTVAVTAARGRGKSATLGLGIAAAISHSYSNIIVTAPSPEMLLTVFQFVQAGLEALGMKEHADFELAYESRADGKTPAEKILTQINVFRNHQQTIKYVSPNEDSIAWQADLLVIDEAAAIPLPVVRKLLGPGSIFISSTVNGYEGTGRSLSLKLIHDLKVGAQSGTKTVAPLLLPTIGSKQSGCISQRSLKEVSMKEPIRYSPNDPIETWLYELLCLNATVPSPMSNKNSLVPADRCQLYIVNRDALFSYHKSSELFLQNMMSLFVSSHYKNSPNDLALISDAPAHQIFVLLPPIAENHNTIPDIYCAIQVCIEGQLSNDTVRGAIGRGQKPSGDMLAWTLSQYFSDEDFGSLTGVRIVRIACHPQLHRMGYGSETIKRLLLFYKGHGIPFNGGELNIAETELKDEDEDKCGSFENQNSLVVVELTEKFLRIETIASKMCFFCEVFSNSLPVSNLLTEVLEPKKVPPLLHPCCEADSPIRVDYFGTSFGFTANLYKFWSKLGFQPVYIRQTKTDTTGENSGVMIRPMEFNINGTPDPEKFLLQAFVEDFRMRFLHLLGSCFSHFPISLALSILDPPVTQAHQKPCDDETEGKSKNSSTICFPDITSKNIYQFFSEHDINRLKKYAQQLADHHFISDLVPTLAWLLFSRRFRSLSLSYLQCSILLAVGSQRRSTEDLSSELGVPHNQVMALFNKAINKISKHLQNLIELGVAEDLFKTGESADTVKPSSLGKGSVVAEEGSLLINSFQAELQEGAKKVEQQITQQRREFMESLKSEELKKYSLESVSDVDFANELNGKMVVSGSISIKRKNSHKSVGYRNKDLAITGVLSKKRKERDGKRTRLS
ncbi:ATPase (DUF699) protein [Cardiosporidium cionae]|uniref:RNA cytidine acetyltransferase n=1 Tax=Cardiosporidium cionae TaxID=476202 RepID=A0ABQ7JDX5_9APIC|nr:ATPase (DUF699) protein [Cardiosporidium cionae]|eukprot:KAF8822215.1 ATPase (DUF699) protein [Cardiosporidium cionae]